MTPKREFINEQIADAEMVRNLLDPGDKFGATQPSPMVRGSDWVRHSKKHPARSPWDTATEYYIQCQAFGLETLRDTVEMDYDIRGGVPVLKGTRFTIAQLLAEISETAGPDEIAENFDLNADLIRRFLDGLSLLVNKPYRK